MKILGCKLIPVTRGQATLKEAVDEAFEEYLKNPTDFLYAIGSVVGPHPFPGAFFFAQLLQCLWTDGVRVCRDGPRLPGYRGS